MLPSVSRIIYVYDDMLITDKKERIFSREPRSLWKKLPLKSYKVTYTLDDTGPLEVIRRNIMMVRSITSNVEVGVCFLPKNWNGGKVRRKVEIIILEEDNKNISAELVGNSVV